MSEADQPTVTPAKDGRGGFFAVDRRTWHLVAGLGLNPAIAYLVMARGTGGDNRTTGWSANAIRKYTPVSRSRSYAAIEALEAGGAVRRDPASKQDHPRYKLVPAHEIRGCEGFPPTALDAEHERVHAALGDGWVEVPPSLPRRGDAFQRWGTTRPHAVAEDLVKAARAERYQNGHYFRAIRYDAEANARPDWIWLPNALVDGAVDETPPIKLMHQAGNPLALRMLVNLYGSQTLDEDGGIHFRRIREQYTRIKVGQQGAWVVWGFASPQPHAWINVPFVAPHFQAASNDEARKSASEEFWNCWNLLHRTGLVEFVAHLVTRDDASGEVLHPVALPGTGLEIEQELGKAAYHAGATLVTPGQLEWADKQDVRAIVPVERHMEHVAMLGIARLRYRPRTTRTMAFIAREKDWERELARLRKIAEAGAAGMHAQPPLQHQG